MFRVNQKVVCVDDSPGKASGFPSGLVKGREYTIAKISAVSHIMVHTDTKSYWCPSRFRPIDDLTAELAQTELSRVVEEKPEHLNIPQHA